MTTFDDTPSISVDFMEITTPDTVLMPDQETALMAAQVAGYQMDSYRHAYWTLYICVAYARTSVS